MNLDQINPECFILALFIRDDGQRFLLGSGAYMFKKSQQQFAANTYANDVVEVQGDDGVFLAGQVRRPSTQNFDGYVGDATVSKADIEEYRKDFLAFFRKNYYYTVVYIFPNGEAIQRRKGFIVDAPEVKELFQIHPEYHIALNFEDINYYSYSEDPDGHETYTKSATVYLSTGASSGGLIWDNIGAVSSSSRNLMRFDALNNILQPQASKYQDGITFTTNEDGSVTVSGKSTNVVTFEWAGIALATGSYTLSGCPDGGSDSTYRMDAVYTSGGSGWIGYDYGSGISFVTTSQSTITVRIRIASGATINDVVFTPVLKSSYLKSAEGSELVIDGTTPAPQNVFTPQTLAFTLSAGTYTWSINVLSGSTSGSGAFAIYLRSAATTSGNEIANRTNSTMSTPITFTLSETKTVYFQIYCNAAGRVFDNYTLGMQIEQGSKATPYSPYNGDNAEGFVWEAGSSAGPTTVMVDSIDRVYPIWQLTGPATNPQLAVLTTGTTLTYSGSITSTQTLEVNMFNKTATLNGASVIGNVSGDWVYFAAGNNRVTYTTNNADANPSNIYWQEVVG